MQNNNTPRAIALSRAELALIRQMETRRIEQEERAERFQAMFGRFIDATIAGLLFGFLLIVVHYFASIPEPLPFEVEPHTDSIVEGISR